mmetsp:Transcript_70561/g.147786  ORF Transcript_70561/g.147786 Transcript_70561/m.147786 type:complete len:588 (-) Transcript_70561:162-1925(-)
MLVQVGKRFVSEQREIDLQFTKGMKELLSKSKVFEDCHDEFIRDLIVSSNRKEYPPNRYLMEEGTRGDSMIVLFKGGVEVTANGRYVCKLRDGSIVGESALLNIDSKRTASVRSIQKCDVAIIFRSTFHSILEKYPWEKRKFQREMKGKLMELGKLIDSKDDINLEQQTAQCDMLKTIPLFSHDEAMDEFVAELAMNGSTHWFRPGRVIIQEGDTRCDEMYVLLKGAVEVTACGEFLGRLENDIFGEVGLLDLLERRTANVIAATQCHCMMFRREVVIPVLAKYPDARMKLLQHARQRLVALNESITLQEKHSKGGAKSRGLHTTAPLPTRLEGCAVGFGPSLPPGDAHLFAASHLFQDCPIDLLRELSSRFETKKYADRAVIIKEGSDFRLDSDYIFFIARGQVEVWAGGHFVTLLTDGEVFGDLAAFEATDSNFVRRKCQVISKGPTTLRAITGSNLMTALKSQPDEELMQVWAEIRQQRYAKVQFKQDTQKQSVKLRTDPLDVMFMKLPMVVLPSTAKGREPVRVPQIEGLQLAIEDSCREGAAWRTSSAVAAALSAREAPAAIGLPPPVTPVLSIQPPKSARH